MDILKHLEETKANRPYDFSVPREGGEFLHMLVTLRQPKIILELGACVGYSAIWLGLAASKYRGKVYSIEINPERVEEVRKNVEEAGLSDTVTVIEGDANLVVENLHDHNIPTPVDFAFIDAVKKDYQPQFLSLYDQLSDNGLIVSDNMNSHQEKLQEYKEFLEKMKKEGKVETLTVPVGTGMEMTVKTVL